MKQVCAAIFMDVSQAFDEVWHQGLEYKLEKDLPKQIYSVLKSYLAEIHFKVKHERLSPTPGSHKSILALESACT